MQVVVEQVPAPLVYELRRRVLRANQTNPDVAFSGDEAGTHFAAFDETSAIVGVASLIPEAVPGTEEPSWRLRGMACAPEVQGQGVGRELVAAVLEQTVAEGGDLCWCYARLGAVGFYERLGFVRIGDEFDMPRIGPHIEMHRHLDASDAS